MRPGGHEEDEVEDGVRKEHIQATAHPNWAAGKRRLPEIFAIRKATGARRDKNRWEPDHEDADVQGEYGIPSRKRDAEQSGEMGANAEHQTCRSKHHEWEQGESHLLGNIGRRRTFDMSGGTRGRAQRPLRRPLDGGVKSHCGCHSKRRSPSSKMPRPEDSRGKRNMTSPFGAATVLSPPSTPSSGRFKAFGQFVWTT